MVERLPMTQPTELTARPRAELINLKGPPSDKCAFDSIPKIPENTKEFALLLSPHAHLLMLISSCSSPHAHLLMLISLSSSLHVGETGMSMNPTTAIEGLG
jgi:hypothetical protein